MIKIIFFTIILSLVTSCAGSDARSTLIAMKGVDTIIQKSSNNYHIYSTKGIGTLTLNLEKRSLVTLSFYYKKNIPFKQLEGVLVSNYPEGADISKQLIKSGKLIIKEKSLFFHSQNSAANWEIHFIDYFRN